MTAMFRTASSSGIGCSAPSRMAREKRSPWIVYWSQGANSRASALWPERSEPSSMRMRVGRSFGALKGISISTRPPVPTSWTRW